VDDETLAFARQLFDLAREGRAEELAAGADPLRGSPDAVATAQFFELPDMVQLLTRDPL
jgi:hypothetical protein